MTQELLLALPQLRFLLGSLVGLGRGLDLFLGVVLEGIFICVVDFERSKGSKHVDFFLGDEATEGD